MIANSPVDTSMDVASRIRSLRQRCQLSMRQLAEKAGVAPSYVAGVEAGRVSPTIATLRKLLIAMGTDLHTFFSDDASGQEGNVFRRENMRTALDAGRCYVFLLPRRSDIKMELMDEEIKPSEIPEFEEIPSDFAGYVLQGDLVLEIKGQPEQTLRPGDAFFVPGGNQVRGWCAGEETVRLFTVQVPPKY